MKVERLLTIEGDQLREVFSVWQSSINNQETLTKQEPTKVGHAYAF